MRKDEDVCERCDVEAGIKLFEEKTGNKLWVCKKCYKRLKKGKR